MEKKEELSADMNETATSRTTRQRLKPEYNPFRKLGIPMNPEQPPSVQAVSRAWRDRVAQLPRPIDQSELRLLNDARDYMVRAMKKQTEINILL